jgi:uncharacterized protein YeeX (DUF496 family)
MFSREKIAKAAQDLADHLQIIENVKALQTAQKEMADAIRALDDRVRSIEIDMRAMKAEIRLDAIREVQTLVNAVQGGLNQRIEDIAVKLALVAHETTPGAIGVRAREGAPGLIPPRDGQA